MINIILVILSFVAVVVFVFNKIIKYKRFSYVNNLNIVYERMEMFFIRNDILLKNDYIELMKVFKNLTANPEYLDIQILLAHKIASEKLGRLKEDTQWFDRTLKSLGPDFDKIFIDFDKNTNEIIKISFYKPDFLFFILKVIILQTITSGAKTLKSVISDLHYAKANDEAISYSGMKLNFS